MFIGEVLARKPNMFILVFPLLSYPQDWMSIDDQRKIGYTLSLTLFKVTPCI